MTIEITGNETLEEMEAILDELDDAVVVDESQEAEPVSDLAPEQKTDTDEASSEADFEKTQRLLDVRDKQLAKLGVDPADLPENLDITDAQMDELQENYPEIAPVLNAINENTDLSEWKQDQGDRWNVALHIDDTLLADTPETPSTTDTPVTTDTPSESVTEKANKVGYGSEQIQQRSAGDRTQISRPNLDDTNVLYVQMG